MIDVSPAYQFEQRFHINAYSEDQVLFGSVVAKALGGPMLELYFLETYQGVGGARNSREAIAGFNKRFSAFCDSLPDDAILIWRRMPYEDTYSSFERGTTERRVLCRVSAYRRKR